MKIVVFGGGGLVGTRFINLQKDNFDIQFPSIAEVDILNKDAAADFLQSSDAEAVINFAAITDVEKSEAEAGDKNGLCYQVNAMGAKNVADTCKELDKYLIHISTEYVFDGNKSESPYTEEDTPNPRNWYGATKLFGEEFVLGSGCKATVMRISMPYSPFYELKSDIARFFLAQLKKGNPIKAIEDQRVTPTLVDDIVNALEALLEKQALGLYHVSARDSVTPLEFAKTIAEAFNLNYSLISPITFEEYNKNKKAKLLQYSWLNPAKFNLEFGDEILHTVEESLAFFKEEIDVSLLN